MDNALNRAIEQQVAILCSEIMLRLPDRKENWLADAESSELASVTAKKGEEKSAISERRGC